MNITIVIAISTTATINVGPICAGDTTKPIWTVTKNVGASSNALFDPETKTVFVSQISGKGDAKDGAGVVSRRHSDGKMINFEWAASLDAPKGMARYGKNLWVIVYFVPLFADAWATLNLNESLSKKGCEPTNAQITSPSRFNRKVSCICNSSRDPSGG